MCLRRSLRPSSLCPAFLSVRPASGGRFPRSAPLSRVGGRFARRPCLAVVGRGLASGWPGPLSGGAGSCRAGCWKWVQTFAPRWSCRGRVMLTVGKVGPGNAGYYQSTVVAGVEDYYAGDGDEPGVWVGHCDLVGAVAGSLATAVDAGMLLEAKCAPDGTRLGKTTVSERSVTAFDLTFSAPKSVSVLYALGDLMLWPRWRRRTRLRWSRRSSRCRLGSRTPERVTPVLRWWMPMGCWVCGIGIARAGRWIHSCTITC